MTGTGRQSGEGSQAAWQQTARTFTAAVESGRLNIPLPGSGATAQRWAVLADLAGEDLSLARLCEGHADDAVAILAELGGPRPSPGSRWGVWAANPPGPKVRAGATPLVPSEAAGSVKADIEEIKEKVRR
jgi:hypothetical protein